MSSDPKSDSIYGNPRPNPKAASSSTSNFPSSSSLAFSTQLASLISKESDPSSSSTSATARGRPRPSKNSKSDIFAKHNKGAQKRAAKDEAEDDSGALRQVHQRTEDIGTVDAATLHRSKRRMEEKARMYEDMKNGMYLAAGSDDEDEDDDNGRRSRAEPGRKEDDYLVRLRRKEREGLIDFDRKWADEERAKGRLPGSDDDDDDDDDDDKVQEEENKDNDDDDDNASIISYEDELGRTRHGTKKQAAHATRLKQQEQQDNETNGARQQNWKPSRPENLIFGPAIQTEAFNPSAQTTEQMSHLAARRDRSPTPPEETHYDPESEVRNRGTGFFAFSKDEETRRRQMEELMNVREETQREREGRQRRRAEREQMKDERRKKVEELRVKRRAETFLAGLGDLGSLGSGVQVDG